MRSFGSDNHSGVHPQIMDAILNANQDHAPSYGTDEWTERALLEFRRCFGEKAQTFFVFNGTAANVTALRAICRPFQSIFVSDTSHLWWDECAAPELFVGGRLLPLGTEQGKIKFEEIEKNWVRRGDQHYAQTAVISLTQPTELGTVYSLEEVRRIVDWAHKNQVYVHIDGARLANAAYFLNKTLKEITTDLDIDVVSFGGTKNGLLAGEAVVFLNSNLARDFKYIRKQSAQLPSKTRFISAAFHAYLNRDLWRDIAHHAHQMALRLRQGVEEIEGIGITQPTQSNAVFARIPSKWVRPLRDHYFFYVWDEKTFECRWMTSWDTRPEDVDGFILAFKEMKL